MNDREKTAIRLLVEYRQEARKLGWGCDSLDAEATKVIDSAIVDSERPAAATFDGIDTMEVGRDCEAAWVRMGGVSFQFTRGGVGVIEVDAYADRGGTEPMQTMRVQTSIRTRVNVAVEVEVETTPGDDPIRRAVRAVRDGEGTVVAHEIVK